MSDLISRQAALAELDKAAWGKDWDKALAAKMLKSLPSAQPELIEKTAYIRGFEQGRTQGMIDSRRRKSHSQTCNQLATDTIQTDLITKIQNGIKSTDADDVYSCGVRNGLRWCISLIDDKAPLYENFPSAQEWIPCSERLPEDNIAVIVTWVNRNPPAYYSEVKDIPYTSTAHYDSGKWWWDSCTCQEYLDEYHESPADDVHEDIEILAWMPLPDPWKGDNE